MLISCDAVKLIRRKWWHLICERSCIGITKLLKSMPTHSFCARNGAHFLYGVLSLDSGGSRHGCGLQIAQLTSGSFSLAFRSFAAMY